jgi:hypothetical protein
VRVSLSPSACAELADLVQHPVSRSRQGGQSTCATVTERKTGSYPGRWPRSAQRCVATAEATGVGSAWRGRHPGQRPPTYVEQPCEGCGEVHVQGPSCGLVPASNVNWLADVPSNISFYAFGQVAGRQLAAPCSRFRRNVRPVARAPRTTERRAPRRNRATSSRQPAGVSPVWGDARVPGSSTPGVGRDLDVEAEEDRPRCGAGNRPVRSMKRSLQRR